MVLNALADLFRDTPKFNLYDLPGFPWEKYNDQWSRYTEAERWFTGAALEDQEDTKTKGDLYPMKVNPIVSTVMKHAAVLFGEVEDDARPLVVPRFVYKPGDESMKEEAAKAEDIINTLWWENHGRAIMVEGGFFSQVYGGAVLKATYVPWEWDKYEGRRTIPFRTEIINPKDFIGTPDASDKFHLLEAWIVKVIGSTEARILGYEEDEEEIWYVEHWTPENISITVDGKPAKRNGFELSGPNPWGFIPMVYIPHIRVGEFLGFNAYSHLVGMVKEMNIRWGDYGDAVNDDSHPLVAARNISGSLQVKRVNSWLEYVDLGSVAGITNSEKDPDMFQVNEPRASTSMQSLVDSIIAQYRRDSFVPPVADGEDEGSQRSGLTLSIRFWPLTSHCGLERYFWTSALNVFTRMLIKMMYLKKVEGVSESMTKMRIRQKWAPMLPRDREIEVNEWGVRSSNTIASFEHLVELSGDVEDILEERDRTLQWVEDLEKAKLKAAHEFEMELAEKQAETQKDLAETNAEVGLTQTTMQGENQLKLADKQAQAFKSKPPQGGGGKKPGGDK